MTVGRHDVLNADQARQRAALVIARIRAGEDPVPLPLAARFNGGPTVADLAERYLEEHAAVRIKPRTQQQVRGMLDNHILPALGGQPLEAVGRSDIVEFHQRLSDRPVAANKCVKVPSHVCPLGEGWGLVPEGFNPCRSVEKYPERPRQRFLTGCRKSEILTLRWSEVDLDAGEIRLADSKTGPRMVPLNRVPFPGPAAGCAGRGALVGRLRECLAERGAAEADGGRFIRRETEPDWRSGVETLLGEANAHLDKMEKLAPRAEKGADSPRSLTAELDRALQDDRGAVPAPSEPGRRLEAPSGGGSGGGVLEGRRAAEPGP